MAARTKAPDTLPVLERFIYALTLGIDLAVSVFPLCFIIAAVGYGSILLWQSAIMKNDFRIKPAVSLEGPGLNEAMYEYKRLGEFAIGRSLLDPLLLRDLRRQYSTSPWISEVCSLRRVFPDKVFVEFIPREPFTQVLENGYYWLVDREGMLLPVAGARTARAGLPVLRGAINNRPKNGQIWSDSGVLGAVRALVTIRNSALARYLPVREVVLKRSEFIDRLSHPGRSRPRLEMHTVNGYTVLWGTVSTDFPGELSDGEKVALLRQLVAECPNNGRSGISLDVRTGVAGYKIQP